ncbi:MAG TPA: FxLYD domain-containing protein [Meiothermus sp.]|nr:FxLYD domain-containing protein [Meiothermus sp.]
MMGFVLSGLGVAGLIYGLWRVRRQRAEVLLSSLVLLVIGYTLVVDGAHTAQLPSFAQNAPNPNEGRALGGGLRYFGLEWKEANGQRFVVGKIENAANQPFDRLEVVLEFFDVAGNPLGIATAPLPRLEAKQTAEFRIPSPFPNAHSFRFLRVNLP